MAKVILAQEDIGNVNLAMELMDQNGRGKAREKWQCTKNFSME